MEQPEASTAPPQTETSGSVKTAPEKKSGILDRLKFLTRLRNRQKGQQLPDNTEQIAQDRNVVGVVENAVSSGKPQHFAESHWEEQRFNALEASGATLTDDELHLKAIRIAQSQLQPGQSLSEHIVAEIEDGLRSKHAGQSPTPISAATGETKPTAVAPKTSQPEEKAA